MFERIAIFGVGLLGGSLGMACRARGLAGEVIGVGRSEQRLARAKELGAIDRYTTDPQNGFASADLIVMAAPVRTIIETMPIVRGAARAGALVTDVGSSKGSIVQTAQGVFRGSGILFIGSHPMAGSERTGVEHARADLYEGAPCYVTPCGDSPAAPVERLKAFWERLGARVTLMPAERHDRIVAFLSHLPHAAAVAVIAALGASGEERGLMRSLAGPGLLDTTRVAGGSTDMWRDIFQENRACVLEAIDALTRALADLRGAIEADNLRRLEAILDDARSLRCSLGNENSGAK